MGLDPLCMVTESVTVLGGQWGLRKAWLRQPGKALSCGAWKPTGRQPGLLHSLSLSQSQKPSFLPVQGEGAVSPAGEEENAPGRRSLMGEVEEGKGRGAAAHMARDAGPK